MGKSLLWQLAENNLAEICWNLAGAGPYFDGRLKKTLYLGRLRKKHEA